MNDDRANDTCAEATIDDLPRDAEGRVILDPAGVVEDRDGRGITTLARGLSFEGLKAELTRIHEALDAPTRAIALQVWESAARAAAAMAPNPAANEEEPLTIRGDLGATVTAFLEASPDLTATFPSQPSPAPASPKDDVASPSAAQTVAQAASVYAGERAGALAESHAPPEVWHAIGSAAYHGHLAGAAWMRERVLAAAPCAKWISSRSQCLGARVAHTDPTRHAYVPPLWLTALCASDVEKETPG